MSKFNALALGALLVTLAGCGQGHDDTLADGAVDRAQDGGEEPAQNAGPPMAPSAAAGPATGRTGMDSGSSTGAPAAGSPASSGATLRIGQDATHGPYIVDSGGIALYAVEGDRAGEKCVGDCLKAWPPVLVGDVQPTGETGLQGAMISMITRPDGSRQVTFDGRPVYRYAADGGAGRTNGHGVKDAYGTWSLLSPQGGVVSASR